MKGLSILGSTGSIGTNVLRVVDAFPGRFEVVGLAAGGNVEVLAGQVARHRPKVVSVADPAALERLSRLVDLSGLRAVAGRDGMVEVATRDEARTVVASAVGAVGLVPTYRALEAGKDVALANKETLVMAGELMLARARETGARVLPIDSEHCALHECLDGRRPEDVRRLVLTASGGPFRDRSRESFDRITREEALAHPTWRMGPKITIDSATLMNKGLEVIEARWLFGVPAARIDVLVHPQSIVHSMVELVDGTVLAQLGVTDMRMPIQYALSYPEKWEAAIPGLDFSKAMRLDFAPPDRSKFPCLALAYRALEQGGTAPAALNAANEEAVAAFLDGRTPFPAIPETIQEILETEPKAAARALGDVLEADRRARERARHALARRAPVRSAP
ncbi:MAG TPA: 1-deoxy-D-xylulose-5-phosphate reductoisomerase [Vicinamibacteria bacterium]|nr:1-deoxy-D-xylulose-5-phosphate reductoisomerase [Vicinamibacteria bacterium]